MKSNPKTLSLVQNRRLVQVFQNKKNTFLNAKSRFWNNLKIVISILHQANHCGDKWNAAELTFKLSPDRGNCQYIYSIKS